MKLLKSFGLNIVVAIGCYSCVESPLTLPTITISSYSNTLVSLNSCTDISDNGSQILTTLNYQLKNGNISDYNVEWHEVYFEGRLKKYNPSITNKVIVNQSKIEKRTCYYFGFQKSLDRSIAIFLFAKDGSTKNPIAVSNSVNILIDKPNGAN